MENDFKIRNTTENDYPTMCEWWKFFRFPIVDRDFLPDDISSGIMVEYQNQNLCSGFIYRTSSSSLFWCEFIVSSPNIKDKEVRKEGLRLLVNGLVYMAKEMGAKAIFTSLVNPNLVNVFEDCNFTKSKNNAFEMIYAVSQ